MCILGAQSILPLEGSHAPLLCESTVRCNVAWIRLKMRMCAEWQIEMQVASRVI